jgi:molecular chaperone Hsp33
MSVRAPVPAVDDLVQPFMIEGSGLRGRLVRLGPAVDAVLRRHAYPVPVAQLLGEAMALAAALAGALKYDGVFTLQTKGDGPVSLTVADVTSDGNMRAYAQFDATRLAAAQSGPVESPVPRLLGAGYLAFTVDQGAHTERYQGIVELVGPTLAECVHHYFRQSDQLQAGIRTACAQDADGRWRAGALMLQRIAAEGGHVDLPPGDDPRRAQLDLDDLDDGPEEETPGDENWRRALILLGTTKTQELLRPDVDPDALLFQLFHEDGVRVFGRQRLTDRCRCSRHRVEAMLAAIPRSELADLRIDDKVVVTCEFCNAAYDFAENDLDTLYGDVAAQPEVVDTH